MHHRGHAAFVTLSSFCCTNAVLKTPRRFGIYQTPPAITVNFMLSRTDHYDCETIANLPTESPKIAGKFLRPTFFVYFSTHRRGDKMYILFKVFLIQLLSTRKNTQKEKNKVCRPPCLMMGVTRSQLSPADRQNNVLY